MRAVNSIDGPKKNFMTQQKNNLLFLGQRYIKVFSSNQGSAGFIKNINAILNEFSPRCVFSMLYKPC